MSVAEIMGRTTLTRKSFYVYFRDRYELIARLLAPLRAELDGLIAEARQGTSDRRTEMRAAFLTVARFYKEHGALLRALAEASPHDADAARAWRGFTEPPTRVVVDVIRQDLAGGLIVGLDPEPTARALVGMNLYAFFELLVDKPRADPEPIVDTLVEIWMRALYGGPVAARPGRIDRGAPRG